MAPNIERLTRMLEYIKANISDDDLTADFWLREYEPMKFRGCAVGLSAHLFAEDGFRMDTTADGISYTPGLYTPETNTFHVNDNAIGLFFNVPFADAERLFFYGADVAPSKAELVRDLTNYIHDNTPI